MPDFRLIPLDRITLCWWMEFDYFLDYYKTLKLWFEVKFLKLHKNEEQKG